MEIHGIHLESLWNLDQFSDRWIYVPLDFKRIPWCSLQNGWSSQFPSGAHPHGGATDGGDSQCTALAHHIARVQPAAPKILNKIGPDLSDLCALALYVDLYWAMDFFHETIVAIVQQFEKWKSSANDPCLPSSSPYSPAKSQLLRNERSKSHTLLKHSTITP